MQVKDISHTANFDTYNQCGLYIAQPKQYIATHLLYWLAMVIYYASTVAVIFSH